MLPMQLLQNEKANSLAEVLTSVYSVFIILPVRGATYK